MGLGFFSLPMKFFIDQNIIVQHTLIVFLLIKIGCAAARDLINILDEFYEDRNQFASILQRV